MPTSRLLLALWLWLVPIASYAALAIDGTASGTGSASSSTVATSTGLTTTSTNDVVVALITNFSSGTAQTVSSIAGCSLSWTKRTSTGSLSIAFGRTGDADVWYAIATSTVSACTVTATLSGSPSGGGADICVVGISGASTATPFDTNGALPASGSSTSLVARPALSGISTTAANTITIGITIANWSGGTSGHPDSGFTTINVTNVTAGQHDNEYKINVAALNNQTIGFGTGDGGGGWVIILDAVQQSTGGGGGGTNFVFVPSIVP